MQSLEVVLTELQSTDVAKRREAAQTLMRMGPDARLGAVDLVRRTVDDDELTRESAVATLEDLGPPPAEQLADLSQMLLADNADIGYWAATLIGRLGEAAAPEVPKLVTVLEHSPHENVRQRAVWALGRIGPAAEPALEQLTPLAEGRQQTDPRTQRLAADACRQIAGG